MFTRLMTLVLAFSLFSMSAMATTQDGLKTAFDEFNYSVTVEWDQKDPSFFEAKKLELSQAIASLEAEGMTREELITFTKSQIKDASVLKDLNTALEAVSQNTMTSAQAQEFMMKSIKATQGASWDGAVIILTPIGVVILLLIIIIVAK